MGQQTVTPSAMFTKGSVPMKLEKGKPCVTNICIGDTLYIVEAVASEDASETAYDKVKRLILANVNPPEKLSEMTQKSA